jgi:hypothetical protein
VQTLESAPSAHGAAPQTPTFVNPSLRVIDTRGRFQT